MARNTKNKSRKRVPPKTPPQPINGGSTGLASFFRSPIFLIFASVFIVLIVAEVWFSYRPRLVTVVIAVAVLTLGLGGVWLLLRPRRRSDEHEDAQLLNETHGLRDYSKEPKKEFGSLIAPAQPPPSQTPPQSVGSDNASWAELRLLREAHRDLRNKVGEIDARLSELERERDYPTSPKPMEERTPLAVAQASPARRPSPIYNVYEESQPYAPSIDLANLNQAVCQFLAEEPGGWEIDQLLQSVQRSSDGSAPKVEHLSPYSSGEWRLVALWPQSSQEGLVLVSSGELVDDEIAKYFDVGFGRRIIACKQPARVTRTGSEIVVLSRGRVESS